MLTNLGEYFPVARGEERKSKEGMAQKNSIPIHPCLSAIQFSAIWSKTTPSFNGNTVRQVAINCNISIDSRGKGEGERGK